MISPDSPENESQRQLAVEKYQLLDTLPEESFDNITALMSYVCDAPISLITLLDRNRNFLKSHHGVPFSESPREISFCGHAINSEDPITIVEDARLDDRFHDNPLVEEHNAIFYAGVPLVNPDGFKLGTLCVYDVKPRSLTDSQRQALLAMAKQVIRLFEERFKNIRLLEMQARLEQRNKNLERFAGVVSHDLKSPLAQITALTELLEQDLGKDIDADSSQYLEYIKMSSDSLRGYIDGMLKFYKADSLTKLEKEEFDVVSFMEGIEAMFKGDQSATINLISSVKSINTNKAALSQIMVNLISNAVKYNDKSRPVINVRLDASEEMYQFSVEDNGPGISSESLESIFDLFTTATKMDKYGNEGTGIGLAMVKKVIVNLGGAISVQSQPGEGSLFSFELPK